MSSGDDVRELANMEVLSAKLLHDVAGAVSALVNHVECVIEDVGSDEVREVLEDALEDAILRFRLIRHAYSISGDSGSFGDIKERLEKYLAKKGIDKLDFNIEGSFPDAGQLEIINRLIVHAVLFAAMIMVRGKSIVVSVVNEGNVVRIGLDLFADEISVHKDVEDVFVSSNRRKKQLTTHDVQAYFMLALLDRYGAKLEYSIGSSRIEIILPA